ncbi:hypothetical protein GGR42_003070 [Saonia flava]|uniref:Vitellogenin II n=1 Tax=Saonia flava TaxID=523696 RepID=A0A846R734_9FLAO|nr:hypothetical protein [Saonia flava]NJB72579.1 hypothetical protein [Saonia flava]
MMIQSHIPTNIKTYTLLSFLGFLVASCGSYQQASYYDNDGIYSNRENEVAVESRHNPEIQAQKKEADPYGDYFEQRANEYDEILDSEVFTDIDGYYGEAETDSLAVAQKEDYFSSENDYNGYAGWGDNSTSVSINIHSGLGFGFYDYGTPWGWNNWGWNNWGWNNWGWNNWGYPGYYGYGWNNWGWNNWGWGYYGYYNPWFNGYGWRNYYGYAYNPYYNRSRHYAYNNSRRGYYNRNAIAANSLRGRSNPALRSNLNTSRYRTTGTRSNINRSSTSARPNTNYRTGTTSRRAVSVDGVERNSAYRASRSTRAVPRYNSSSRSSQTYRGTTPRTSGYRSGTSTGTRNGYSTSRSTTPRTSTYRSSRTPATNNRTYRSSRSSSPRSSSYRSSNSSSRSSGSYRSSSPSRSSSSGSYRSSGSSSSGRSSGSSGRSSSSGGRRN